MTTSSKHSHHQQHHKKFSFIPVSQPIPSLCLLDNEHLTNGLDKVLWVYDTQVKSTDEMDLQVDVAYQRFRQNYSDYNTVLYHNNDDIQTSSSEHLLHTGQESPMHSPKDHERVLYIKSIPYINSGTSSRNHRNSESVVPKLEDLITECQRILTEYDPTVFIIYTTRHPMRFFRTTADNTTIVETFKRVHDVNSVTVGARQDLRTWMNTTRDQLDGHWFDAYDVAYEVESLFNRSTHMITSAIRRRTPIEAMPFSSQFRLFDNILHHFLGTMRTYLNELDRDIYTNASSIHTLFRNASHCTPFISQYASELTIMFMNTVSLQFVINPSETGGSILYHAAPNSPDGYSYEEYGSSSNETVVCMDVSPQVLKLFWKRRPPPFILMDI